MTKGTNDILHALARQGQHDLVIASSKSQISERTANAETYLLAARSLAALKRLDDAVSSYRSALALEPKSSVILRELGVCLFAAQRLDEALATFEQAAEAAPGDAIFQSCLGQAHLKAGHIDQAVIHLAKAVALGGDWALDWANLGIAMTHLGRHDDAADSFRAAAKLLPKDQPIAQWVLSAFENASLNKIPDDVLKTAFTAAYPDFFGSHPTLHAAVSPVVPFIQRHGPSHAGSVIIDPPQTIHLAVGDPPQEDGFDAVPTWAAPIPNAEVIAGWDQVILESGEVLNDIGYLPLLALKQKQPWLPHFYSMGSEKVLHPSTDECQVIDEPVLFLSTPVEYQIGHWIVDFLPRLRARAVGSAAGAIKVATVKSLPRKHRDLLQRFGVGPEDIFGMEFGRRYRFSTLWVLGQGRRQDPTPQRIQFLHRHLHDPAMRAAIRGSKKVMFLERSETSRGRAIRNGNEFKDVLGEFNASTIRLSDTSVPEQVRALSATDILISAMGSDVCAMFHLPPKAQVIVLVHDDLEQINMEGDVRAFERCAAVLGMTARRLVCASAVNEQDNNNNEWRRKWYTHLVVNCGQLRRMLQDGGAHQHTSEFLGRSSPI